MNIGSAVSNNAYDVRVWTNGLHDKDFSMELFFVIDIWAAWNNNDDV